MLGEQLAIQDSYSFIEKLLAQKDDCQDAAEDVSDLQNFYKTQISIWRKLLAALGQFADNREALEKIPQAASALAELAKIRDSAQPYGLINRIEPLISTVSTANEALAQEKRERALLSIDSKLAEVQKHLDAHAASADLRNKALKPLQDLKTEIAGISSIARIFYLQNLANDAMDDAIALIDAAKHAPTLKPEQPVQPHLVNPTTKAETRGQPATHTVTVKSIQAVRAADVLAQCYLETEADVDAYISKLKAELLAVVRAGKKARVQ